jgi:uncharacterized protein DUF3455
MNARFGHGVMVTLLLASGCGSNGLGTGNHQGGDAAGNAGGAGGASGSAGGEPAAGGATGDGTIGPGTAGDGSYGTGGAMSSMSNAGASGAGGGSGVSGATGGGGVAGTTWLTPPPVPPALVPPAGATVKLHAHAVGAQIYTCTASGRGNTDGGADADAGAATYAWVLKAPDAKLYDSSGTQVGTHGAGPSWTWRDGSVANGAKVAELDAPAADAISWLLLRVTSTTGAGMLSDVTYVQRLNTAAGKAPATVCDATTVGTDVRAGYSADYYFYSGGGAASWLTTPDVPSGLAAPTDARLALHDHGIGVQIYTCVAMSGADGGADAGATTFAWVFRSPDALLFDMAFTPVALHGAGPSWTSTDGSIVEAREIARADAPRPDAIPWLLLKELSTSGPGVFTDVAFIQRINTAGGVAPATGCDASTVNTQIRVPYSADYYFYVSINPRDGGAGG